MIPTTARTRRKAGAAVSVQAIRWAMRQRTGGPETKAVLLIMAEHADRTGAAHPSTRTIADEAECAPRSARRHLDRLRDLGLLSWAPGAGRAPNQYQLAMTDEATVVGHPDAPHDHDVAGHPRAPQQQPATGAPGRPTDTDRSGAPSDRSGAVDHRSGATRAADQQERNQNHYVEPKNIEPAAPPPPAQARGRGAARTREALTPEDLAATAHRPDAAVLVAAWRQHNPGITGPQHRKLRRAVSELLDQGADPALIPAALDEVHTNPRWQVPHVALPMAYEDVRRAHQRASRPQPTSATTRRNATDENISRLLAGTPSIPLALGGAS